MVKYKYLYYYQYYGIVSYSEEQHRKKQLLKHLLNNYNDGRKRTLFCVVVNLLKIEGLENIIDLLDQTSLLDQKEKASRAAALLQEAAQESNIILKLRRKK